MTSRAALGILHWVGLENLCAYRLIVRGLACWTKSYRLRTDSKRHLARSSAPATHANKLSSRLAPFCKSNYYTGGPSPTTLNRWMAEVDIGWGTSVGQEPDRVKEVPAPCRTFLLIVGGRLGLGGRVLVKWRGGYRRAARIVWWQ